MTAWAGPRAPKLNDMADLGQRQAETASATDEGQQSQDIGGVSAVAGPCSPRRQQDAAGLIQAQRLPGEAALGCDVPNQEPVVHGRRIGLAPRVKVKSGGAMPVHRLEEFGVEVDVRVLIREGGPPVSDEGKVLKP